YVAELEPGDLDEDTAALRIARAVRASNVRLSGPASGRVNFLSNVRGVLRVDAERLARLNEVEGLTLASLRRHNPVRVRQMVATVKVIPYAVPETSVRAAEAIAAEGGPLVAVDTLTIESAALILSGSPPVRERVLRDFDPPLRERLEALGVAVRAVEFVPLEDDRGEAQLAATIRTQVAAGAGLIVLAGETAIMDRHDIAPRAIERVGGVVICVGAPVDPGNLLMLARVGEVPVLGAPGCARSRKTNIVDWVLPRLLAGDHLTRADIVALGHGGLLEDIPERPMPRSRVRDS
ncbi:MAG: molybdopterin-binding protein, partial [Anaerolineales bacterium]